MSASQNSQPPVIVTAAILVIGDEILSGRTKDKNIGYIAEYLTNIGIELREVRVVPDVTDEIVAALNALRARYTYVFTTGGIGPTHDDITADSVAAAFGELSEAFASRSRKTFDEMAEEMLRPMLQDWLDNNLPALVERLVREEIERVARGA